VAVVGNRKMTRPINISRINWRLILIHFIATWFFIQSFFILSFLHDLKAYEVFTDKWRKEYFDEARFMNVINWMYTSPYIGLLVAFAISLTISIKRKWLWLNSLLVFILSYLLKRFGLDGWKFLKMIFLTPGQYFNHHSAWYYLANGLPMLILGFVLFYSKWTNHFISNSSFKIDENDMPTTTKASLGA
jgi:hypothetical protein